MASTRGRSVVVPLTNKSGGSVAAGDVVVVDTGNDAAFTTSTAGAVTGGVGVAQETIANNAAGRVLLHGYAALVNTSASVTRGNYGKTHTVAKQAVDAGASRVAGTFCQFLTGGTTPTARVFAPDLGAAAGNVAVDAIWDAAGDLAVGSGADTAARLAKGNAGGVLAMGNSAVIWNAGTSFPASKATNDKFCRTDLTVRDYFWDGTRWVSEQVFEWATGLSAVVSASNGIVASFASLGVASGLWLIDIRWSYFVATTHSATQYWTLQLVNSNTGNVGSALVSDKATVNASVTPVPTAIGSAGPGFQPDLYYLALTKTSTPGNIQFAAAVRYRLIAT